MNSLKQALLCLVCMSFLLGSFIHLFDTALSAANVVSVALFPVMLFLLLQERFSRSGILVFSGLFLFAVFCLVAVLLNPEPDNFRLTRSMLVAASGVFWANWLGGKYPAVVPRAIACAFAVSFGVAVAQVLFVLYGVGIDPTSYDDAVFYADSAFLSGFPSIFGNPNNFSVFSCLVFLYFMLRNGRVANVISVLAFAAVMLSGSKVAFLLCLFGPLIIVSRYRKAVVTAGAIMIGVTAFYLGSQLEATEIYAIDRLVWTALEIADGTYGED